jgi:hypothetical protein
MNKFVFAITFACLASSLLPACKKDMPPVVAARWDAIEDLARAAGPNCDEVLAQPKCLESVHRPYPEAGPRERLPASLLVGATEVRQVEVYCEAKAKSEETFTRSCYLQPYFDPHSSQRDAAWMCGRDKPYPGWEHTKDGLALAYEDGCQEKLYHAWMRRKSPAGNTVQAAAYFYVDGQPPAAAPAPESK